MPLAGGWTGSYTHVQLVEETVLCFPGDKKERDPTHARLAKKIAAREAQKEQSAGVGEAAPDTGEARKQQLLARLEVERARLAREKQSELVKSELMQLGLKELLLRSLLSAAAPGTGEQARMQLVRVCGCAACGCVGACVRVVTSVFVCAGKRRTRVKACYSRGSGA